MAYILVLSGPSGVGKSTLLTRLIQDYKDEIYFSVSCTTRAPREGEVDGLHYHFITEAEFQKYKAQNAFLEWARVHNHFYGSLKENNFKALEQGKVVLFDIDVQGFLSIKEKLKDELSSIFILTKSKDELKKRLLKRNAENTQALEKRLQEAENEMKALQEYDFFIINEDLEQSYKELESIFQACKKRLRTKDMQNIQKQWKGD